jgi:thioredoxin 1
MSKHTHPIDTSNFDHDVLESDVPVVLEVTASYCGPCRALAPILETFAAEARGAYRVGVLDLDEAPEIGRRLGVRGVPTILVFSGGQERARRTGVVGLDVLRKMIAAVQPAPQETCVST